ncbi:DUF4190 domain-containing protein [Streptomyces sp. NPDC088387]|uniref:DUF4190 domain-containing protein n=1 Tax=Streptomyces sp. NPDC088387 TaxID=3365859 RepID=UPI00382C0E30
MSIPPPPSDPQPQDPFAPPPDPQRHPQGPFAPPGTYGQQPWMPYAPRTPGVNALAVTALILGILCLLPAVGLVFGLIALWQIRRRGERGKGMAITGAALSTVGLLLWTAFFTTGAASDFWDGVEEGVREEAVMSVAEGKCFDTLSGSLEGMAYDVEEVPCAGRHDGEVFATITLPGGGYPGEDHLVEVADEQCYDRQDEYVIDTWAVPGDADVYYFYPTRESWRFGDREITCVFGNTDASASLTGSLRADETTLDNDQLVYLEADRVLTAALESVPLEEYVEDDLPGHKVWAERVTAALNQEIGSLDRHTWSADAQKPVATLVTDLRRAKKEWSKAAAAEDADTFYVHMDKGYELTDPERTVPAREALGLATVPPELYEEDGGDVAEEAGDAQV